MIKENVEFKCATLTDVRLFALLAALERVGLKASCVPGKGTVKFIYVGSNAVQFGADAWPFCDFDLPEVTLQQALDLIATVEKPAPVFDIKPFDRVLIRDGKEKAWTADAYSHIHADGNKYVCCGTHPLKIIHFEGNEKLVGEIDTPSGWWEVEDGGPKWVTE